MERIYAGKEPRKIVVTGGSGFLGQQLLKICSENGHKVVNIDLNPPRNNQYQEIPYIKADLSDPMSATRAFAEAKWDYFQGEINDIFHMAAIVSYTKSYRELEGPNVLAARNVAKECINHDAFLVHMSGTAVLGHVNRAMCEDDPLNPVEDYGSSKADAEKKIFYLSNSQGLKGIILRATAPVGPGLETAGINGVYKMILDQPTVMATKGSMVTYVSTEDIARAFLFAAENQDKIRQRADSLDKIVYNIGVHQPFSDKQMGEYLISSILGEGEKKVMEVPHWFVYAGSYFIRAGNMIANFGRMMVGNRRKEPDISPSLAKLMKGPHFQNYTKFERHFENNGFKFNYPTPKEVLDTGVVHKFKTEWKHLQPPKKTQKLIETKKE